MLNTDNLREIMKPKINDNTIKLSAKVDADYGVAYAMFYLNKCGIDTPIYLKLSNGSNDDETNLNARNRQLIDLGIYNSYMQYFNQFANGGNNEKAELTTLKDAIKYYRNNGLVALCEKLEKQDYPDLISAEYLNDLIKQEIESGTPMYGNIAHYATALCENDETRYFMYDVEMGVFQDPRPISSIDDLELIKNFEENLTADEIAEVEYMLGVYTYEDYKNVCYGEETKPLTEKELNIKYMR